MEEEIIKLEEELRLAMLNSDVEKLDALIADSLIFIAPQGEVITKQIDLDVQRNKIQQISKLTPSEQQIQMYDDLAVVTVKMNIVGAFSGIDISGTYRYIRTWKKFDNIWQIIAGAVIQIK